MVPFGYLPFSGLPMFDKTQQEKAIQKERARLREAYRSRAPAPERGHVEMFMVHDEGYHEIYLDGEHVEDTADKYARIHTYPMSHSWRCDLAARAGVAEDGLRFTYSRPCFRANDEQLEADDLTYEMMVKWRGEYPDTFDFHAIDLDKVEEMVRNGQF